MGNCPRKTSGFCKRRNAPQNVGQSFHCPRCQLQFGTNATIAAINQHMDSCMNNLENGTAINPPVSIQGETTVIKIAPNSIEAKRDQQFYWVKKEDNDHNLIWVKERAQNRFDHAILAKVSLKEAARLRFEDKRKWFRVRVERFRIPWTIGADVLRVEREDLLNSSVRNIKKCNLFKVKEVKVEFKNDEKVNDAGGLLREWITLILRELVKPELGIFSKADNAELSYTINPRADNTTPTLDMYEFAGRVIGKAVFERITLNLHFDDCTLKYLTGHPLCLEDLQSLDGPLYSSLAYIRDNSIDGSDVFQEYFVVPSRDEPGKELCPNGATKLVTDSNKHEYIQYLVDWYGKQRNERKLNALLNGVATAIAIDDLAVFDAKELDMIIGGVPFIDVDDWEANTIYKGSLYRAHEIIGWFWQEMRSCNQKQLARILQFCTGSSRTPVEESNRGAYSKFCIDSTKYVKGESFITAHTCFNRIVLPMFPSQQLLREHLKLIFETEFNGVFGIE